MAMLSVIEFLDNVIQSTAKPLEINANIKFDETALATGNGSLCKHKEHKKTLTISFPNELKMITSLLQNYHKATRKYAQRFLNRVANWVARSSGSALRFNGAVFNVTNSPLFPSYVSIVLA